MSIGTYTYMNLGVCWGYLKEKVRQAEKVKITSGIINNSGVAKSQQ
jgi:hypothetical protein